MKRVAILFLLVGCNGTVNMSGDGADADGGGGGGGGGNGADGGEDGGGGGGSGRLAILSPEPGKTFKRNDVGQLGYLVAAVPFELEVPDGTHKVAYHINGGEERDRVGGPDFALTVEIRTSGTANVKVIAYDRDGAELDRATVELEAIDPTPGGCHGWLDLYQVEYTVGPNQPGVDDPVTVKLPINGVRYRYVTLDAPRTSWYMDCEMAKTLARNAPILRERDVVEVADIGLYNYRCINHAGTPPNCTYGMSEHSWGTAIDRAGFKTKDGTFYSVLNHWVIDANGVGTCAANTENARDEFLHDLICAEWRQDLWNIALTPNYNSIHRNHFHTDLTPGGDTINLLDVSSDVDVAPGGWIGDE